MLGLLVAACGAATRTTTATLEPVRLPGWTAVRDTPGISSLAPDLSGLHVTEEADAPALTRAGDAIRASAFTFATDADGARALGRARDDGYGRELEKAFRGTVESRTLGKDRVVWVFRVPRPAEPGSDTVQLEVVRHGRTLRLLELVSARGLSLRTAAG